MARVMENHSKSLLPIPDVTSTTTRGFATQVHMLNGGKTHTALQGQSQARVGCAARSRQGSLEWVSEQRAHSIGLAAAAVLVAPLVRVLSSAISSTMCAASENTAAVTMPARWWER